MTPRVDLAPDNDDRARALDGLALMHLRWLEQRSLSPETIRCRRNALQRLTRWLGRPPLGATREEVEAFAVARRRGEGGRGEPLQDDTFRAELAHLRGFYGWAVRFELRHDDPTARIPMPRKQHVQVHSIPDDDLARVLEGCDVEDRALLALAAFAGLRAMEIAALDWRDVDRRRGVLHVRRGKGGRPRTIAISEPLLAALDALPHRSGPVVRRRDGEGGPCTPNGVTKRAGRLLGGRRDGWTLHQLRHRFATAGYRGTLDLRGVQDALGHSSPAVTAIYIDADADARDAVVRAAARLGVAS